MTDPLTITIEHAAARLEMSTAWTEREIAAGRLPSVKYGRARRIKVSDLEQFVATRNDAQPAKVVTMRRRRPSRQHVSADAPPGGWPLKAFAPAAVSSGRGGRGR